jgi:fructoselysine-6-P-deglycase FrlB-like protein
VARKGDTPETIALRAAWEESRATSMRLTYEYQRARVGDKAAAAAAVEEAETAQQAAWVAYSTLMRELGLMAPLGEAAFGEWY